MKQYKLKQNILYIVFLIFLGLIYFFVTYITRYNVINYGVTKQRIRFGQSVVLSGSSKSSGIDYRDGILAGISDYNSSTRNNKPIIEVYSIDDQYEASKAIENTKMLVNYYDIFAMIGSWGTPTSNEIYKYVSVKKDIPFIGPLTGSNILRKTFYEDLIFIRPSYNSEIECIFNYAKSIGKYHFSVLYQNDEFGLSVLQDIQYNLFTNQDFQFVSKGEYTRNDVNIENGIKEIFNINNPFIVDEIITSPYLKTIEFIICVSTDEQAFRFIKYIKRYNPDIIIFNISFVNRNSLNNKLKEYNITDENIYCTSVIPFHDTKNNKKLMDNLRKYIPNPTPINLEGYILGRFLSEIMKNLNGSSIITREQFVNTIYDVSTFDIDGYKLGPFVKNKCNVGFDKVYLLEYSREIKGFKQIHTYNTKEC